MAEDKQTPEEEVVEETVETPDVDTDATADVDPIVALETKIAEAEEKIAEAEDKYLRAHAEMQNMQTRYAKEQATAVKYASQNLAKSVLPALDNLERALQVEADDTVTKQIKTGVEMTLKTLVQALADNGISATGEVGEAFDPTKHQAIQSVASEDVASDEIAAVLQKGYMIQDRVLRPAMVAVAK